MARATEVGPFGESGRFGSVDAGALVAGAVGVVSLLVAFVGFLTGSSVTAFAVLAFVLTVGYGWYAHQAETARGLTFLATVSTLVTMGLIIVFLFSESLPAFEEMGLGLLTRTRQPLWGGEVYSLVPLVWGTFVTTILATLVAAPFGVAGALFIAEIAPPRVRTVVKPAIEMLAGIPTIVYGFLGFQILNPYAMDAFGLPGLGSLFFVGLAIGVIALPTVVSVAEDAITSVPDSMKSGSLALGTTDWQTTTGITLPAAFSGVSAAVLLGVGRAVGETMAATVILGNVVELPDPLYDVFGNTITLTTAIASQYGNANTLQLSALFAAGVVLFVTVMVLSVASRIIERRMERTLGGNE